MTDDNRVERFAAALGILAATFKTPLPALMVEGYRRALADLPITAIEAAVAELLASAHYMPTPVEIREAADGTLAEAAEDAWVELRETVRDHGYMQAPKAWRDPLIKQAAYDIYGTWARLCAELPSPERGAGYAAAAAEFKARFTTLLRREEKAERARLREAPRRQLGDGEEGA